jgi:hypothetical protein
MSNYEIAAEKVDKKIRFYRNFMAYVIVNAFLALINFLFTPFYWWVMFPMFFWGIGVVVDFFRAFVFSDAFSGDYRERKIVEEMEKMKL